MFKKRTHCLLLYPKGFLLCFFPKTFILYGFTFSLWFMLVNLCIRCEVEVEIHFCWPVDAQLPSTNCSTPRLAFFHWVAFTPLAKLSTFLWIHLFYSMLLPYLFCTVLGADFLILTYILSFSLCLYSLKLNSYL